MSVDPGTGYDTSLNGAEDRYGGLVDPSGSGSYTTGYLKQSTSMTQLMGKANWTPVGHMNGPSFNALSEAESRWNIVQAQMRYWSHPARKAMTDRFGELVRKYGNTNTPGTLLGIAQSGLDDATPAIQSVLQTDAKARQQTYSELAPKTAGSIAAQVEDSAWDTAWAPVEFMSRNALAGAMMPLEATQGYLRNAGGILTGGAEPIEKVGMMGANALSMLPFVAPFIDGAIPDDQFQNPWEQTNFGQTLLSAAGGQGFDAFTTQQAGLDVGKALRELMESPEYAHLVGTPDQEAALIPLAEEMAKQKGYYSSPGWFIDETSPIGEAQRQSTFNAWAIPGPEGQLTSWTLGRGIASNIAGPDHAAYGIMSGFIDAVASVVGDPTIIGAKFGVASKTLRGAGVLLEKGYLVPGVKVAGAERVMTVGKEARAARQAMGAQNRTIAKAVDEYNAGMTAINPQHVPITAEQFAMMDLAQKAETVRDARLMQSRTDALARVQPDVDDIAQTSRSFNRNLTTLRKAENIDSTVPEATWTREADGTHVSSAGTVLTKVKGGWSDGTATFRTLADAKGAPTPGSALYNRGRELVNESIMMTERGFTPDGEAVFDADAFYSWWGALDPTDRDILRHMWDIEDSLERSGAITGTAKERAAQFLDYLSQPSPLKRGTIEPETVTRDAVQQVLDQKWEEARVVLETQDSLGATLLDAPVRGEPVLGVSISPSGAKVDTISYWVGEGDPVLANVEDVVDPTVLQGIKDGFDNALSDARYDIPRQAVAPEDADTIVSEIASVSERAADLRGIIADAVNYPGTTYGLILAAARQAGFDGLYDDILRSAGVDGLLGTSRVSGRGAWMGEHPSIETFALPQDIYSKAVQVGGSLDKEAALAQIAEPAIRADLRGATPDQMRSFLGGATSTALKDRASIMQAQQAAVVKARLEKARLDNAEQAITARFADPNRFAREVLHYESGLTESTIRGHHIDPERARWFLFGNGSHSFLANRTLEALSMFLTDAQIAKYAKMPRDTEEFATFAQEWIGQLSMVTRHQWDSATYKAVLDNALAEGGPDGLLRLLATRVGVDVGKGDIMRSLSVSAQDGAKQFRTWRTPLGPVGRAVRRAAGEYPGSRSVNLDVAEEVVENLIRYGRYAKVTDEELAPLIGKAMWHDGGPGTTAANRQVLTDLFDIIGERLVNNVEEAKVMFLGKAGRRRKDELIAAMKDSTRLYLNGKTDEATSMYGHWVLDTNGVAPIDADGMILPMGDFQIDSELAHGFINLPSVEDFAAGVNRISRTIARFEPVEGAYKFARRIYDNVFRTALLVGRISYIVRNSAEMQIRMFLNGHESVFSDPATMIGMSLGNMATRRLPSNRAAKMLHDTFAPYRDTVLGTAWETGKNEARAAANHVQQYFALVRQAHALTDPRVYNSAARGGWKSLGPKAGRFNQGWANELIMLHNSDIARLVVSGAPVDFTRGRKFLDNRDATVKFFLSDNEQMVNLRALMVSGDEKFRPIFASEAATREYLYDHPMSVFARVTDMTLGGDPVMMDFIKSGKFRHDANEVFDVNIEESLKKRMTDLSSLLKNRYRGDPESDKRVIQWFEDKQVMVPYTDQIAKKRGTGFVDAFFSVANKIERIGTVGPEYRLAYWDKIAELAPTLRIEDVDRALRAARTTLSPIKRVTGPSMLDSIGEGHPAWAALNRAKESGSDGLLTLDELHAVANAHAGEVVSGLFYDAAKRNDFWSATRLIFPFGQAWGNTLKTWVELGARRPVQVYKVQKAFNAMLQSGSSALYEFGSEIGAYNDYAPGMAPWDQAANGGFMYSDKYGDTSFVMPYVGYTLGLPAQFLADRAGANVDVPNTIDVQSPAQSMNLALGADSVFPGASWVGTSTLDALNRMMPDNELISQMQSVAAPYGDRSLTSNGIASWLLKVFGGAGSLPVVGPVLEGLIGSLAPEQKAKYTREAMTMLATSGNYTITDPISLQKMQTDAGTLARAMLLSTGLLQNWMFSTPVPQMSFELGKDGVEGEKELTGLQYGIGMFNVMFGSYRVEAGGDEEQARMDLVKDFGPAALFAIAGEWKGLSGYPSSDALKWANRNPVVANAEDNYVYLFFRKGDGSDIQARRWLTRNSEETAVRRTPSEMSQEFVSWMQRIQRSHIDSLEANGVIPPEEAAEMKDKMEERYVGVDTGTTTTLFSGTREIEHLKWMVGHYPELDSLPSTQAFKIALKYRDQALAAARDALGRDNATLAGETVTPIRERYLADVQAIMDKVPDFYLLGTRLLREYN